MLKLLAAGLFGMLGLGSHAALAAEFDVGAAHTAFIEAFNSRNWDALRGALADDVAFHRANAPETYAGPDKVVEIFSGTIGANDQWNVKFAKLDSDSKFVGKDGRVVERGDFAITAGEGDASCYAGSYMMTWLPVGDAWKLQSLAWQDVETDITTCK